MTQPQPEAEYPCSECGKLRTKAEGGTTFTVCDECWDKLRLESEVIKTEATTTGQAHVVSRQLADEARLIGFSTSALAADICFAIGLQCTKDVPGDWNATLCAQLVEVAIRRTLSSNSAQNMREDLDKTPRTDALSDDMRHDDAWANSTRYMRMRTHARSLERENIQLRAELEEASKDFTNQTSVLTRIVFEKAELRQQLSNEAAARSEITRKYHDECAKLAQELKDERASVRRQKEMVEVWRIRAEAYKQNAEGTGKELTTTAARLAEAMKRLESCVVSVNRQYPHRRDSNEDSKFLLFLSGKLNEVFSPAEPTAIDEALRNKWIDEVEAIRAATKQAT